MKKSVSMQNSSGNGTRVRGMYGSIHSDTYSVRMRNGDGNGLFARRELPAQDLDGGRRENGRIKSGTGLGSGSRPASSAAAVKAIETGPAAGAVLGGLGGGFGKSHRHRASGMDELEVVRGHRIDVDAPVHTLQSLLGRITLRGILLSLAGAAVIAVSLILMLFNFEHSLVYGNTMYSQEQIESFITRGRLGDNTFVMALRYHHRKVEDIPFVDRIDIDIVNPSTVRVNITEKPKDGWIYYNGRNVYFSKEGEIETVSGRTAEGATKINGVVLTHANVGMPVLAKNQLGLDRSLELLRAMDKYGIHADSIDVDEKSSLTASFGGVQVHVGRTEYDSKMFRIHQILPWLKGKNGVISMAEYNYSGGDVVLSPFKPAAAVDETDTKTETVADIKEETEKETEKETDDIEENMVEKTEEASKENLEEASEEAEQKTGQAAEKEKDPEKSDRKTDKTDTEKTETEKTQKTETKKTETEKTQKAETDKTEAEKTQKAETKKAETEKKQKAETKKAETEKTQKAETEKTEAEKTQKAETKRAETEKTQKAETKKAETGGTEKAETEKAGSAEQKKTKAVD